jgi:urea transporter
MGRWLRQLAGVILGLAGVIWLLQGVGVIRGSFMTGSALWAVIGAVLILFAAWILGGDQRRRR